MEPPKADVRNKPVKAKPSRAATTTQQSLEPAKAMHKKKKPTKAEPSLPAKPLHPSRAHCAGSPSFLSGCRRRQPKPRNVQSVCACNHAFQHGYHLHGLAIDPWHNVVSDLLHLPDQGGLHGCKESLKASFPLLILRFNESSLHGSATCIDL